MLLPRTLKLLSPRLRRRSGVVLAMMLFAAVLEMASIGLVVPAIGLLAGDQPRLPVIGELPADLEATLESVPLNQRVLWGAVVLLSVFLVKGVYLAWLAWVQSGFVLAIQQEVSSGLFRRYLGQPYTFHLQRNSAELIRNVTQEVKNFIGFAVRPTLILVLEAMTAVAIVGVLFLEEPVGALAVAGVFGIAALIFDRITRKRLTRWGKARQEHEGKRIQHVQQGLGSVKDIILLGREEEFLGRFDHHTLASARLGRRNTFVQQLPRLWIETLAVAGMAALAVVMVMQEKDSEVIVETVGLFAVAAFRLMPSSNRAINSLNSLRFGRAVVDLVESELEGLPLPSQRVSQQQPILQNQVEVKGLSVTYPGAERASLKDVSFTVQRGHSLGIIGPSGAGKSTLVDSLLGLIEPRAGQVLVDGTPIASGNAAWQRQIGYVPQTIYLTDDTLRRNIALGVPDEDIDDTAVWRALEDAQLEAFVRGLDGGLDTAVGEQGVKLSGGQRQRIGVARALYHDPAILVLDEATSALDIEVEAEMMAAVSRLGGEKTLIIVTHRLTSIEDVDRVLRLEEGRVVAEGPYSDVVASHPES